MSILRRLIYGEVLLTVGFVCLVFLGLFFFFDLIDELQWVGTVSYTHLTLPTNREV